jgi:hypothetical protein
VTKWEEKKLVGEEVKGIKGENISPFAWLK